MTDLLEFISKLNAKARRGLIMLLDVMMVLITIPISLLLSRSNLAFDPFSTKGLAIWAGVGLFSHLLFRYSGFYNTVWRFASTPDFFRIITSCGILALGLYLVAQTVSTVAPQTGLNERQFIVFFLVSFTVISAPRLIYRYLREGASWASIGIERRKRAIFVGKPDEADVIIRFAQSNVQDDIHIAGILATNDDVPVGTRLRGVPVVGSHPRLLPIFDDYIKGTSNIDLLIFGQGVEKELKEFSELIRIARQNDVPVVQFSGFSQVRQGGKMVLEAIEMETILRRSTVPTDVKRLGRFLKGKRVLVTGGAGSIGRTLVRRTLEMQAEAVLVADVSEFGIFQLRDHVRQIDLDRLSCRVLDVGDRQQFTRVVTDFRPDVIFHAAALKHVPILEENWESAIKTNVFATLACAEVAAECEVPHFVMISSDKAADPTSILGLTKRLAEQIVSALHYSKRTPGTLGHKRTNFVAVRFGNVFGSDGSVATIFHKQIQAGGPVTITDRAMTRYLMTIGEAVDLVLMAAADSQSRTRFDDFSVYMLDMGEPVSILDVAETMIRLAGKKPYKDIQIKFTGIRPGEKLHEALSAQGEKVVSIDVPKVFGLRTCVFTLREISLTLEQLAVAIERNDKAAAVTAMGKLERPIEDDGTEPVSVAV